MNILYKKSGKNHLKISKNLLFWEDKLLYNLEDLITYSGLLIILLAIIGVIYNG